MDQAHQYEAGYGGMWQGVGACGRDFGRGGGRDFGRGGGRDVGRGGGRVWRHVAGVGVCGKGSGHMAWIGTCGGGGGMW